MKRSHAVALNIFVLLILFAGALFVYRSLHDTGEGAGLLSAALEERVSLRYSQKSVRGEEIGPVAFGKRGYEEGSANIVTSVVVNYRAFDTLLEVIVLFASAAGVSLLVFPRKRKTVTEASGIVKTAIPLIALFIYIAGAVVIIRGHLSPGGGFAGGAVIASGIILTSLIFRKTGKKAVYMVLESIAGLSILALGILGIVKTGSFLQNFLASGRLGSFLSGGTAMVLYTLIGIKVTSEIAGISDVFLGNAKEER